MAHPLLHAGRVLAIALFVTTRAFAATLHVSPAGNDANPGTLAAPLATPGRALAIAADGDTVLLRSGTYSIAKPLAIHQRGLTVRSYPGEHARIVAGTTDLTNLPSVIVVYASRVVIEDLEIQGGSYYGIKLDARDGPQSGIVIRGVKIHHTGRDGIKTQDADGLLIEACEIASTGVRDASNAEGIDVMGSIGVVLRRNHVHDIATTGIYVKAGTRHAVVEANRVERTGQAGILLGSESGGEYMRDGAVYEASDAVARNNIVVDTALAGLGSIAGDNVRFENNTVINAARTGQAVFRAAANEYRTAPRNIVVKNNVLVLAATSRRPMIHLNDYSGSIASDSNAWFSPSGRYGFWRDSTGGPGSYWTSLEQWQAGMSADRRSRTIDPKVDPANLYRLLPGSPAVDSGETLAEVAVDYSGVPRPVGGGFDIGAHEGPARPVTPPAGFRIVR
jgi:hypothetical protein